METNNESTRATGTTSRDADLVPPGSASARVDQATDTKNAPQYVVGDVFQINEAHGRRGWTGAFVLATEIKSWGIQGFVAHIVTHDEQRSVYIRLQWNEIDYIGHATLIPEAA